MGCAAAHPYLTVRSGCTIGCGTWPGAQARCGICARTARLGPVQKTVIRISTLPYRTIASCMTRDRRVSWRAVRQRSNSTNPCLNSHVAAWSNIASFSRKVNAVRQKVRPAGRRSTAVSHGNRAASAIIKGVVGTSLRFRQGGHFMVSIPPPGCVERKTAANLIPISTPELSSGLCLR